MKLEKFRETLKIGLQIPEYKIDQIIAILSKGLDVTITPHKFRFKTEKCSIKMEKSQNQSILTTSDFEASIMGLKNNNIREIKIPTLSYNNQDVFTIDVTLYPFELDLHFFEVEQCECGM